MNIDETAPAVARSQLEIRASREIVWAVLADIEEWPSWNPDVKSATLEGPLAEGTSFRWKSGPGTITSTLRRVEPPRLIAWTGKTFGIEAIHVYRLEDRGGATLASSEESWDGLVVRLLGRSLARRLQKALDAGLRHLQSEAERRAAATAAS
jgi:uncharacterized protein YndB with AHSA1/START domain